MSRPLALVVRGPGTNRDADVSLRPRSRRRRDRAPCSPPMLVRRPELLDEARMLVLAGGFCYADALGAGRLLALELEHGLGDELRSFVAKRRPVIGICNGFQALVRTGLLPGGCRPRGPGPERHRPLRVPLGALQPSSDRCVWTAGLTEPIECPIAHGEGRFACRRGHAGARSAPTTRSPSPTRAPTPTDRLDAIAGICDPTGLVLGLMPHPENHVLARQFPRHTPRRAGRARPRPVRTRRPPRQGAVMTEPPSPVDPRSTCHCPTAASARCGCRTRCRRPSDRLFVTTDRLSAFDRIISGVPYKGQVLNQLAAWWFEQTARHRRQPRRPAAPAAGSERARRRRRPAAAGRGDRARPHHRRHEHVAVEALRRRGAHDLRLRASRRPGEEHGAAGARSSRRPPRPRPAPTTRR